MIGFEYYNPARIVFGEDSAGRLKELLRDQGVTSLLLVYSGDFVRKLGIYAAVEDAVKELGIRFSENGNSKAQKIHNFCAKLQKISDIRNKK
jgi:alcohol dehydrogenase YqhD (iron-dependent ADH family)